MSAEYNVITLPNIINADEAVIRPVWSILSKGRTGTGKTILSCGKEFRPVYVFDLDGRFESVLNFYRKLDGNVKGILYNTFHTNAGYYPIKKRMDEILKLQRERQEFKTISLASLTSFVNTVLKHLQGSATPKEGGKGLRKKGGIQTNILEDFNFEDSAILYELIPFYQELKDCGTNVILEAHITPYELVSLEEGQRVITTINQILTKGKKAPAQIPSYFNEVWSFEKEFTGWERSKEVKYNINTSGSSLDECKTSFDIPSFEWTNEDASIKLVQFLSGDIKNNPRVDPNKSRIEGWGK